MTFRDPFRNRPGVFPDRGLPCHALDLSTLLSEQVGHLHELEGAGIAKAVELIARMAVLLDYMKPLLPGHFVERAEFVVRELSDMAEVLDHTMGLGIYRAKDTATSPLKSGGLK